MNDILTFPAQRMYSVARLKPYGNNSRTHSRSQIQQIAKAIQEFGFTNPILVSDDFEIVAGHGRYLAAKVLGMSTVPCIKLTGLTEQQRRAYVIADNKLAEKAGWDEDLLKLELGSLDRSDFELGVLGFSEKELGRLMADDIDAVGPTQPEEPDELAVVVTCANKDEQDAAYDLLVSNGFACRTSALKGTVTGR